MEKEENRNYWERDEIKKFLTLAEKKMSFENCAMFYLLIYTELRKGELVVLEWNDIDFEEKHMHINKTMFYKDRKYIVQTAKTKSAVRVIDLDEKTVNLLSKLRLRQKETLLAAGMTRDLRPLFIRSDLQPIRTAYPNELLSLFIDAHGPHKITVQGLRHTHASMLFAAGATIKDVQQRLGHRSAKVTMDIYTHLTKERNIKINDVLQNYMKLNSIWSIYG